MAPWSNLEEAVKQLSGMKTPAEIPPIGYIKDAEIIIQSPNNSMISMTRQELADNIKASLEDVVKNNKFPKVPVTVDRVTLMIKDGDAYRTEIFNIEISTVIDKATGNVVGTTVNVIP